MGERAAADIEPGEEVRIVSHRRHDALIGHGPDERQGGVVEREGRGARHRTRHIGNAVMDHAFFQVDGFGMGGGARGFKTAALVDGDIDHDRARTHGRDQLP